MLLRIISHFLFVVFLTLIHKVSCQGASLTFVIDTTHSMSKDINQVRKDVNSIVNNVLDKKSSQISNIVLVTFNNPAEPELRITTSNRDEFKRALAEVKVGGGGHCAELALSGLKLGLESSSPGSSIYVFTDAAAKDYHMSDEIQQLCQRKQSQIKFVLTGDCGHPEAQNFQVYYNISTACSGQVIRIPKWKLNMLGMFLEEDLKDSNTALTSLLTPPNVRTAVPFSIDELVHNVRVDATGTNLHLMNFKGPSSSENVIWEDHIKLVKLTNTEPGEYMVTVKSDSVSSVVISGKSDFYFRHGFSEQQPKTLDGTAPQPISDTLTRLSMLVTDPNDAVRIQSAQILDMKENVIKEMPLTELWPNFYTTERFVAPTHMFKVALTGKVIQTNNSVRRLAEVPITPQNLPPGTPKAKAPVVEITEGASVEVARGSAVTLTCKVSAYPVPEITWTNELGIKLQSQTSTVQIPYDYISYLKIANASEARYSCNATINDYSSQSSAIDVIIKDPFIINAVTNGTIKIPYGTESTLNCDVRSQQPLQIRWYHENKLTGATEHLIPSKMYTTSSDGTQLKILFMKADLVGRYICKVFLLRDPTQKREFSTNVEISGLVPARIITDVLTYEGSIKDIALRVPCDTIGNPKPTISWDVNGSPVNSDKKYNIEDGALIIKYPTKSDGKEMYTCTALNDAGSDNKTFKVNVVDTLTDYGITHNLYILEGDSTKLLCTPRNATLSTVQWLVRRSSSKVGADETILDKPYYSIDNAQESHDGNYTCHISDIHGSVTKTFEVDVGYPPRFKPSSHGSFHEWSGDTKVSLICDAHAKPPVTVEWTVNDEPVVNASSMALTIFKSGHYKCSVSNVHGEVHREFEVQASNCLISRKNKVTSHMPLMLTEDLTWPDFPASGEYMIIKPGVKLMLSCNNQEKSPNSFRKFPALSEIEASCIKGDTFTVDGEPYQLQDLQCTNEMYPSVVNTNSTCLTKTSELIKVGYGLKAFIDAYEVCFDYARNIPLYTRVVMSKTNNIPSAVNEWFEYPGIGNGRAEADTCKNSSSSCCYAKTQLASATDFSYGPAQNSSFIYPLNAIPNWRPCDSNRTTWAKVENIVRAQFDREPRIVVFSGVHTLQEDKNGAIIPRFLWKVVRENEDEAIAIVYVNVAAPTADDIKCNNICAGGDGTWYNTGDKYTYCCNVEDFLNAFKLPGHVVGEDTFGTDKWDDAYINEKFTVDV